MTDPVINCEADEVAGISVLASLPVSALPAAVAAAVTADIVTYFAHILIVLQKLAYLYGFEDFGLKKDEIPPEAMDQIMVFLGVMFGIRGSGPVLEEAAGTVATALPVAGSIASGALMYALFKPRCLKLQQKLKTFQLCDPGFCAAVDSAEQ